MANALYGKGRERFLKGDIDWLADDIKCILVDTNDYSVSIDVDEYLDDIPAGAIVATSSNLSGKTALLGVADASDVTFSSVTGDPCEALVIYKDGGSEGGQLIAYIDTATGLPVTPNGGNITVAWDNGANKIFKL